MPLRAAIRILLSLTIVLIATLGGAQGSTPAAREIAATVQTGAPRTADGGGCTASGQAQCHMLAVADERPIRLQAGERRAARLFAADDPHRAGSHPRLEDEPPRSLR